MQPLTLKEFAEKCGITYEAVRLQVKRYQDELTGHISIQNNTKYLDEFAQNLLKTKLRQAPVLVLNDEHKAEIQAMQEKIDSLYKKLCDTQDELISAQKAQAELLESKVRYQFLLEDHEKLAAAADQAQQELKATENDLQEVKIAAAEDRVKLDKAEEELNRYKKTIFGLYKRI